MYPAFYSYRGARGQDARHVQTIACNRRKVMPNAFRRYCRVKVLVRPPDQKAHGMSEKDIICMVFLFPQRLRDPVSVLFFIVYPPPKRAHCQFRFPPLAIDHFGRFGVHLFYFASFFLIRISIIFFERRLTYPWVGLMAFLNNPLERGRGASGGQQRQLAGQFGLASLMEAP